MSRKRAFWLLALVASLSLLPFLGLTDFNTRGEPREAVVALSMLNSGNWVLPVNNGVEIPFKPPFFHWCIAVCSWCAGAVTEVTSRLPSALSLIGMALACFLFYARRRGVEVALLSSLILLTNCEVHRAGMACRVDMVLTALIVCSLLLLYRWGERGLRGLPYAAVLCLSAAFLTKGPTGIVLPLLVTAVFQLVRGVSLGRVFGRYLLVGLLSCILPMVWYVAAYAQGGQRFLDLVLEENVYRFLGRMTYEAHVNPAYYNVVTVVAGYVPYTLLLLISLFFLHYRRPSWPSQGWQRFKQWLCGMDDARLLSLLSIVLIFVFYCIPKSKRSVYLLPIYPFLAYYLAEYIIYLCRAHRKAVTVFGGIMASLAVLLCVVFVAVRVGLVPQDVFTGRHAEQNRAFMHAISQLPDSWYAGLAMLCPLVGAAGWMVVRRRRPSGPVLAYAVVGVVYSIFLALDGAYQPAVLNVKSDKQVAQAVARIVSQGRIYSYRTDVVPANRMHPFTVNFYLGDRMVPFECFMPEQGYVLMGDDALQDFSARFGQRYALQLVYDSGHISCDDKRVNKLYRFDLKASAGTTDEGGEAGDA